MAGGSGGSVKHVVNKTSNPLKMAAPTNVRSKLSRIRGVGVLAGRRSSGPYTDIKLDISNVKIGRRTTKL